MKQDPLAQVTGLLERAVADIGDVEVVPPERDEATARVRHALEQRRASQRRRKIAIVAAAAAVLLAMGAIAARRSPEPAAKAAVPTSEQARVESTESGLTAVQGGQEAAPASGQRLGDGTELRTAPTAEAHLEFDSGTRVAVGAASRVRLVEQTRHKRFALESGSLHAKVAKLGADERFVVATGDAEIEVRGTEFRVTVAEPTPDCGGGTTTRVDVREGVVVVRHHGAEERVAAGEHWPRCAKDDGPAAGAGAPTAPEASMRPTAASRPAPAAVPAAPNPNAKANTNPDPTSASRLAEQNDLFQEAMRRKRSGDARGALQLLERLHDGYADGPLAENAEVERFRILTRVDRARAASAAREYLRARPRGFARAEAEALVASP